MTDLRIFGITRGEGKAHEEIIYSTALLYNIISTDIAQYLKQYGLTVGKLNILIAIKHHGGEDGLPQVEVSKHLIVTPSNMTKMIDKLEKEGLVARGSLKGDRRVNIIKITKKGAKLLDAIWAGYNAELKSKIACLAKNEQKQLANLLLKWFDRLQNRREGK